jgi:serine/threonine protein kinase
MLLKANGYCCLIDFGLTSKVSKAAIKGRCGTRGYWAPEMVKGDRYLPRSFRARARCRPSCRCCCCCCCRRCAAPHPSSYGRYAFSGDWWSLGVTLLELLTGKKPFKKKFQKYKNTEDKVQIVKAGCVDDAVEERGLDDRFKGGGVQEDHMLC